LDNIIYSAVAKALTVNCIWFSFCEGRWMLPW